MIFLHKADRKAALTFYNNKIDEISTYHLLVYHHVTMVIWLVVIPVNRLRKLAAPNFLSGTQYFTQA